jgi:aryl-alcohol dehydrogenase-like predicted oxidoreductase
MKAAYDAGINYFDTAEGYSSGASEVLLGKAVKKYGWKQNDLVISTKVSELVSLFLAGDHNAAALDAQ